MAYDGSQDSAASGEQAPRRLALFVLIFAAQLGHLFEHIGKALSGRALLGQTLDNELSHLVFNAAIALLAIVLVATYRQNPWVYPLAVLSLLHGFEHVYIFEQYVRSGVSSGPGLLGLGGAIGAIPLGRLDLHNVYNGVEMILMTLGVGYELDGVLIGKTEGGRAA